MTELISLFHHYTFQVVVSGASIIGFTCGSLGTFAYIKHQGMVGDVLSHATLPGVALMFLVFQTRSFLFIGAVLTGMLSMVMVRLLVRNTKTKEDSALGVMLASFFGLGVVLLTVVNTMPSAGKAGLNDFLFGMASSMVMKDVLIFGGVGLFFMMVLRVVWRPLILSHFDPNVAKTLGIRVRFYELLTVMLLTVAIVTGLEMAGVILITSLVIAPAAAARQWTHQVHKMFVLAGCIGALSSATGAILSSLYSLPTGPLIVLITSGATMMSFLFSTKQGVWFLFIKKKRVPSKPC